MLSRPTRVIAAAIIAALLWIPIQFELQPASPVHAHQPQLRETYKQPFLRAQSTQPDVQVVNPQVEYDFGVAITFRATLNSEVPIESAILFLQIEGSTEVEAIPASLGPQGEVSAVYDAVQRPLPVFSQVTYWYQLTLQNEVRFESEPYQFFYTDNRFEWQTLESNPFRLNWYAGDIPFAQEALNVAQAGLQRAQSYLALSPPKIVNIYVYNSARELQTALQLTGQSWVAGHASPDAGKILVSLPPGPDQRLETERQIPHELMHVLLYQKAGDAYTRLPAWLNEGLASLAELSPNLEYQVLLTDAYKKGTLLPLASLCRVFPKDASNALLAYAEAVSFTRYLFNRFGTPGLDQLSDRSIAGVDCEFAVEQGLGINLTRLERDWRQEVFAENLWEKVLEDFLPWLIVLIAVFTAPILLTIVGLRKKTVKPPA